MFNTYKMCSLGLCVAVLISPLMAQEDVLEEVVVTGTRITADGYESVSPVDVITFDEITATGVTRLEDMLNTLPQIETSQTAGFGPSGATGTSSLDLRGLGASRTLVILNGRRLGMGSIYDETPDIGQIPISLLERVDVLTGGASAVYGSDAMAGAVNFITREVEGVEISVMKAGYRTDTGKTSSDVTDRISAKGYPYPSDIVNDGGTTSYDIVMGTGSTNGHITMYARHAENEKVSNADRAFSSCALSVSGTSCSGSANTPVPHFDMYPLLTITASGTEVTSTGASKYTVGKETTFYGIDLFGQLQSDGSILDSSQGTGRYNYAAVAMLALPNVRDSVGAIGRYTLSNRFETYFEVNYSSFNQRANIAESGTFGNDYMDLYWANSNFTPEAKASIARNMSEADYELNYSGCAIQIQSTTTPGSYTCDQQWALPAGVAPGDTVTMNYNVVDKGDDADSFADDTVTTHAFSATWDGVNAGIYKRNTEGGPRTGIIDVNALRYVIGARGDIGVNDFHYDVSYTHATTTSSEAWINDFSAPAIVDAIKNDLGGYDVFKYQGVTAEQAANMGISGMMTGTNTMDNVVGYITGTTSVSMPSAETNISLVGGFESRTLNFERLADYVYENGLALGFGGKTPSISGEYSVNEFFTEASIPLVENVPGVQSLVADIAFRSSEYDLTGNVTTDRFGITYMPNDAIRFRGGISTAERAPTISNLYYPANTSLWSGVDKCSGASPTYTAAQCALTGVTATQYGSVQKSPANQYYSYIGGNPKLKSESAETTTFGVVADLSSLLPSMLTNTTVSLDFWNIDIEGAISGPGAETILEVCATTGQLCDAIHRQATGNLWQVGSGVDLYSFNLGLKTFAGIDISGNTSLDVAGGTLSVSTSLTKITDKYTQTIKGISGTAYDCVGIMSVKCYPSPEWRTRSTFNFNNGGLWSVGATLRTMSGVDVDYASDTISGAAMKDMRSWLDVNASYQLLSNTTMSFSVTNVTDEQPPVLGDAMSGGYGNTLASNYSALGQYWALRMDTTF